MSLILNLRNGKICIPKDYYEKYLANIDWFFSGLIKYTDNETDEPITLWEDKEVVLTIFDSIKFNKLTLHENVSLDYLYNICDMWCVPQWLMEDITKIKNLKDTNKNDNSINNYIFTCEKCGIGFKLAENTRESCKTHCSSISFLGHPNGIFICCGHTPQENPCQIGYHIPKDFIYIKKNLID